MVKKKAIIFFLIALLIGCYSVKRIKQDNWLRSIRDLKDKEGKEIYSERDIDLFRSSGIDFEFIKDLTYLRNSDFNPIFDAATISWLYNSGGDLDYINKAVSFIDKNNETLLRGYHIAQLKALDVDLNRVDSLLGISDEFGVAKIIIKLADIKKPISYIKELYLLKDSYNISYFSPYDIIKLASLNLKVDVIRKTCSIYNDNQLMSGQEIVKFFEADGDLEFIEEMAEKGFSGKSIYRFKQLSLNAEEILEFKDTNKPNALIIYSDYDYNGEFETKESNSIFQGLKKYYDINVRVISNEKEIYKLLSENSNISLFMIAGHGTPESIILDERAFNSKLANYEEYFININDDEFAGYLKSLNDEAVIFLDACENDKSRTNNYNLSQFFAKSSGGKKVISCSVPFTHKDIKILSYYPLSILFNIDETP